MRRILALLVLATTVACGGSESVTPPTQTQGQAFSGTYVLQTVNASPLPFTWNFVTGDSLTVRSYSIVINGSGSWSSTMSQRFTMGGQVTDQPNATQSGSYTYDAGTKAVTLISTDQSTFLKGSVSADFTALTLGQNNDVFVFKR